MKNKTNEKTINDLSPLVKSSLYVNSKELERLRKTRNALSCLKKSDNIDDLINEIGKRKIKKK